MKYCIFSLHEEPHLLHCSPSLKAKLLIKAKQNAVRGLVSPISKIQNHAINRAKPDSIHKYSLKRSLVPIAEAATEPLMVQ